MRFERSTVLVPLALLATASLSATAAAQDPRPERPRLPPVPQQIERPIRVLPATGPVLVEEYAPGRSGPRETVEFMLPGRLRPLRVEYEVIDGLAIAEGDIILGRASEIASAQRQRERCTGDVCTVRQPLMMRTGESFLWPSGVIPYEIDPAFNATMRGRIETAVGWINDRTDLLLIERTDERDFVGVQSVERGCSAAVGRQGNEQSMRLANNCGVGNIAHEFLHAAGMWHEQSRNDRDSFVRVLRNNVEADKRGNFDRKGDDGVDVGGYDYGSIMHYPERAFGIIDDSTTMVRRVTIQVLTSGATIGQRTRLSAGDIAGVNAIYRAEDCLRFSPTRARVAQGNGRWKVMDGNHWLFDFGPSSADRAQANRTLQIIRNYGMDQVCYVGRPNASAQYLLAAGQAPRGAMQGEDCIRFDRANLTVRREGNQYLLTDGRSRMMMFPNAGEAHRTRDLIVQHGFERRCYHQRPNPKFTYFRR